MLATGGTPSSVATPVSLLHRAAGHVRHNSAAHGIARVGLAARGVLYLLLTYLAASLIAERPRDTEPANAQGAMQAVTSTRAGVVALAIAAVGFLGFALVRLAAAWHARRGPLAGRLTTSGQGFVYLVVAYVPITYVLGEHGSGSEQQQHQTSGQILGLPGGQPILLGVGLVVLAMCGWQVRAALRSDYLRGLVLPQRPAALHRSLRFIGLLGIIARAFVFLPIGGFLVLAAVTRDPSRAQGLDAELAVFSGRWWGVPVLLLVCASFLVFAIYSFVEARYRDLADCR